jgi:hypothetical protein
LVKFIKVMSRVGQLARPSSLTTSTVSQFGLLPAFGDVASHFPNTRFLT